MASRQEDSSSGRRPITRRRRTQRVSESSVDEITHEVDTAERSGSSSFADTSSMSLPEYSSASYHSSSSSYWDSSERGTSSSSSENTDTTIGSRSSSLTSSEAGTSSSLSTNTESGSASSAKDSISSSLSSFTRLAEEVRRESNWPPEMEAAALAGLEEAYAGHGGYQHTGEGLVVDSSAASSSSQRRKIHEDSSGSLQSSRSVQSTAELEDLEPKTYRMRDITALAPPDKSIHLDVDSSVFEEPSVDSEVASEASTATGSSRDAAASKVVKSPTPEDSPYNIQYVSYFKLYDLITDGELCRLKKLDFLHQPFKLEMWVGIGEDDLTEWSNVCGYPLPNDLYRFYLMTNGMSVELQVDQPNRELCRIGCIHINPLGDLAPLHLNISRPENPVTKSIPAPEKEDLTDWSAISDKFDPQFNGKFAMFVLDQCREDMGDVLLIYHREKPLKRPKIWLLDRGLRFHFLANSFQGYFSTMVQHHGIDGWQMAVTPYGKSPKTKFWEGRIDRQRSVADAHHGRLFSSVTVENEISRNVWPDTSKRMMSASPDTYARAREQKTTFSYAAKTPPSSMSSATENFAPEFQSALYKLYVEPTPSHQSTSYTVTDQLKSPSSHQSALSTETDKSQHTPSCFVHQHRL